jgi:hypothetical protein
MLFSAEPIEVLSHADLPESESGGGSGVGRFEELFCPGELGVHVARGEQSEVSDLGEALGQDVHQKTPDEFKGRQCFGVAVLCVEGDSLVVEGDEALVGNADPMGVTAEVFEDGAGAGKGLLAVDDPVGVVELAYQGGEPGVFIEVYAVTGEFEHALFSGAIEREEEFTSEELGEDSHREKEALLGGEP